MFVAVVAVVAFSSCSKDDDVKLIDDSVVGTWTTTSVEISGKWYDVTSFPYNKFSASATFFSDGTYFGNGALGNGKGTWEKSGSTITTYVDGEVYIVYKVSSLKGDTMQGTMTMGKTSMNFKAKKQ